jgi:hypothetical protein
MGQQMFLPEGTEMSDTDFGQTPIEPLALLERIKDMLNDLRHTLNEDLDWVDQANDIASRIDRDRSHAPGVERQRKCLTLGELSHLNESIYAECGADSRF